MKIMLLLLIVLAGCVSTSDLFYQTQELYETQDPVTQEQTEWIQPHTTPSAYVTTVAMGDYYQVIVTAHTSEPMYLYHQGSPVITYFHQPHTNLTFDVITQSWLITHNATIWYLVSDIPEILYMSPIETQQFFPVINVGLTYLPLTESYPITLTQPMHQAHCSNLYDAYHFFRYYGRTDCSPANEWCDGADINRDGQADDTDLAIIQSAECDAPVEWYTHVTQQEYIAPTNWTSVSLWFKLNEQGRFTLWSEQFNQQGSGASPYRYLSVFDYEQDDYGMLTDQQRSYQQKLYFVHVVDDMTGSCTESEAFSDSAVQVGQWHHIALVRDGAYKVYLDGEHVLTAPRCDQRRSLIATSIGNSGADVFMGDIRWYAQPLSEAQVRDIYETSR